jgi:predicted small integral membrane protein
MTLRALKALMVIAVGLWATLVAVDNVLDYDANWHFVQHVLSMDTVFPDNALKYRAITDPTIQRVAYWGIIGCQGAIAILCLAGSWRLLRRVPDRAAFAAAKTPAASGLVLLFFLYYIGFVLIGGEWFSMWQSQIWNGQSKAVMFLSCAMLVLIVLLLPEHPDGTN